MVLIPKRNESKGDYTDARSIPPSLSHVQTLPDRSGVTGSVDAVEHILKPYRFHGVHIEVKNGASHAIGDCCFCGKEGKFSVAVDSGLWRCFVCGTGSDKGGGNIWTFLRQLWQRSDEQTKDCKELAVNRKLLYEETAMTWGACKSLITDEWILPAYDSEGRLMQLYRWADDIKKASTQNKVATGKRILLSTSTLHHQLFGMSAEQLAKPEVYLCEGPWDAMALSEVLGKYKMVEGELEPTGSVLTSMLSSIAVLATPGCNVFRAEWVQLFKNKIVTILYDSDHTRTVAGRLVTPGYDGVVRVAKMLSGVAKEIRYLRWGIDNYDPQLPSGYDVRDLITSAGIRLEDRKKAVAKLLSMIQPVSEEIACVLTKSNEGGKQSPKSMEPLYCESWQQLEDTWKSAMQWRQTMADVLATMMAVAVSTNQSGNQLFMQVIGDAGSGKSVMCDALLVSNSCHSLEHITGFHSGWKSKDDPDKDCSLIARINGKTLITPEGDVLISSPRFAEIMSQQRRIFDGTSGATFKNSDTDRRYTDLRTPWIMAGTPALLDTDQSRLGDRFMKIIISPPSEQEKRSILKKALLTEMAAVVETSNGSAGSCIDPKLRKAQAMTGGYLDYLRSVVSDRISQLTITDSVQESLMDYGELVADLRARPNRDPKKHEDHDSKELPTRITRQLGRLAICLAVVLNKTEVDSNILRKVRKVALDTSNGQSLKIVQYFMATNPTTGMNYQQQGLMIGTLQGWLASSEEKVSMYLNFLRKIGVLVHVPTPQTRGYWKLTDRVYNLYTKIMRSV